MDLILFRKNNLEKLFNHVDTILEKAGYDGCEVPKSATKAAALAALQDMHAGKTFYSSTVTEIYEMCGVYLNPKKKAFFRTLHCVEWAAMDPDLKETVIAMIFDGLKGHLMN
ncbi:MAG: hypothetical protein V3T43_06270 [Nitrosomonadaceae bacterium]